MSLSLHRIFDLSIRFSRYDAQEIECVRWKLASISTYSIDCIACLHAMSNSQNCECIVYIHDFICVPAHDREALLRGASYMH